MASLYGILHMQQYIVTYDPRKTPQANAVPGIVYRGVLRIYLFHKLNSEPGHRLFSDCAVQQATCYQ